MSENAGWDALFNPQSIAVVGVSREAGTKSQRWGRGAGLVGVLRKLGFPGRVYPINPGANPAVDEVIGYKVYPRLMAVPEPVDLAIVTVSAKHVPEVLEDCVAAGVRFVHVFSSGFSETGEEAGQQLEGQVREICHRSGLRLVGPNCIGLHLPGARVSTFYAQAQEAGAVAFLSQSGGHTRNFVTSAPEYGMGVSKALNYGNAAVLDSSDYLEYLAADPETRIIGLYLEGVKDGKRFLKAVKEVNRIKPVIIWKGGVTASGARAASAHTGSLAGDKEVWQAVFKHTGAIPVDSLEEMLDVMATLLYAALPVGKRAGVLTMGGGQSVVSADLFALAGFEVPPLPPAVREKLCQFIPSVNTSVKNPVDLGLGLGDLGVYQHTLEVLNEEPSIDFLVVDMNMELMRDVNAALIDGLAELLCRFNGRGAMTKPLAVVLGRWERSIFSPQLRLDLQQRLLRSGIVAYLSLSRACRALAKSMGYREFLKRPD